MKVGDNKILMNQKKVMKIQFEQVIRKSGRLKMSMTVIEKCATDCEVAKTADLKNKTIESPE